MLPQKQLRGAMLDSLILLKGQSVCDLKSIVGLIADKN